ncbi:MAG: hypothetical protein ACM37W_14395 [Actinomycetota bacterium]
MTTKEVKITAALTFLLIALSERQLRAQAATFSAVVASVNESDKRPKNLEKTGRSYSHPLRKDEKQVKAAIRRPRELQKFESDTGICQVLSLAGMNQWLLIPE